MNVRPFLRALQAILPGAELTLMTTRDWCSLTFEGQQLMIRCAAMPDSNVDEIAVILRDHEFAIPKILVADIVVAESGRSSDSITLMIDALLIRE
jgi:hypothetical protein